MSRTQVSLLALRSEPAVRDGFEIFTRALEAGLSLEGAMGLLGESSDSGGSYRRSAGALFAAVAILDRAAAYGARPQIRGRMNSGVSLPFVLRGKARIAALEQLPMAERAEVIAGLLKAARAYVPWLLKRDGELPGDMDEAVPVNDGPTEPPAPLKIEWPTEPMRMEVVKVPPTMATSVVHRDGEGRIGTTVVSTVQAG